MANNEFKEIGSYIEKTANRFKDETEISRDELGQFYDFTEKNSNLELKMISFQNKELSNISKIMKDISDIDTLSALIRNNDSIISLQKIFTDIRRNELNKILAKDTTVDLSILKDFVKNVEIDKIESPNIEVITGDIKQPEINLPKVEEKQTEIKNIITVLNENTNEDLDKVIQLLNNIDKINEKSNQLAFLNEQKETEISKQRDKQTDLLQLIADKEDISDKKDDKKDLKGPLGLIAKAITTIPGIGLLGKGAGGIGKLLGKIPLIGTAFKGIKKVGVKALGKALLKGIGKFVLAPITAIFAAFDFMKGFKNAFEIVGRDDTLGAKIQGGISQVLSGLTFGLIDPKKISEGIDWLSEKIVGVFNDGVKLIKDVFAGEFNIQDKIFTIIEELTGGIITTEKLVEIKNKVTSFITEKINNFIIKPFEFIKNFASELYDSISLKISDSLDIVNGYMESLNNKFESAKKLIKSPLKSIGGLFGFGDEEEEELIKLKNNKKEQIKRTIIEPQSIKEDKIISRIIERKIENTKYSRPIKAIKELETQKKIQEQMKEKERIKQEQINNNVTAINNQTIIETPDMSTSSSDLSLRGL